MTSGPATADRPAHWGGVFAMSLCVFALIASEFMPVSLLTPMANDLGVSEGMAGRGIAVSGAFAVMASLSMSSLAASMDRKTLLLLLTVLMGLSGAVVAWAPNFSSYMAGRALIGAVIGGFWSMSAATAMRLVPARQVPRALAILNGGNAMATVIAAPLGSHLGATLGWRGAFLTLVPVAIAALAWMWLALPPLPACPRPAGPRNPLRLLRRRTVVLGLAGCGAFFMGQFTLFTYVRPFLETVTRVDVPTLSLLLLLMGVMGFMGTVLIGSLLSRSLHMPLVIIPVLMAVIALTLAPLGGHVAPVAMLLGLWGLLATAAPVGWWSWVAQVMPDDAEAGGGMMVAVVQLAIALGSTLGGVLFDSRGHASAFAASAFVLLTSALLSFQASRAPALQAA